MKLLLQFFGNSHRARLDEELSGCCCSMNQRAQADEPSCHFRDVFWMLQRYEVISQVDDVGQDDEFSDIDERLTGEDFPQGHIITVLGLSGIIIYDDNNIVCHSAYFM